MGHTTNEVVNFYEHYREEDRLTTNNARRIEFLTTVRKLDALLKGNLRILDCAAGTGAYAFYLADKGHRLTATDITPRHIGIINERLKNKAYSMDTMVLDATDMRCFPDGAFDAVLNMGPFYHLTDGRAREQCLRESIRVLKTGGYLLTAYIPRLYLNQMIVMSDDRYLDQDLLCRIRDTGVLLHDDPQCFWTDTYYSSAEELQALYRDCGLETVDQFAQDGLAPLFHADVDRWSDEQFHTWFEYHLSVCSEKTAIGMSNHVIAVGRKKRAATD